MQEGKLLRAYYLLSVIDASELIAKVSTVNELIYGTDAYLCYQINISRRYQLFISMNIIIS